MTECEIYAHRSIEQINLIDRDHQKNTEGSIPRRRLLLRRATLQEKHVHSSILLIIKSLKLKTMKNASLKKFDLSI